MRWWGTLGEPSRKERQGQGKADDNGADNAQYVQENYLSLVQVT